MRGMSRYMTLMFLFSSCAAPTAHGSKTYLRTVNVYDEDGVGIESRALRIKDDEALEWIGDTDKLGLLFLNPPIDCLVAKRILVKPKNPLLFETPAYQGCKEMVKFRARRWKTSIDELARTLPEQRIISNLIYNAEEANKNDDHRSAALVYTELSVRFSDVAPALARAFRDEAYIRAGLVLEVDHPVTYQRDGTFRLSHEFQSRLIEFQKENGLKKTGNLDSAALSAMTDQDYSAFLFYRGSGIGGPDLSNSVGGPDTTSGAGITEDELIRTIKSLQASSQRALANKDYGRAAQLYTELSIRLRMPSDKRSVPQAVEAEAQAYKAAGQYFDIKQPTVFDPIQGKAVMSKLLVEEVRRFQIENRIPATGMLDYKTLRAMSSRETRVREE
jgi:hypothetical protein